MSNALRSVLAGALLLWGTPVAAQYEGHTTAATQPTGVSPEEVTACVQSQQQVMALVDAANQRIELARQTNEPAAMRNAVDEFQATLSAVRSQLASCAQLASAAPAAEPHAGHVMPVAASVQPSPAAQPAMPCCAPQAAAAAADAHAGHTMPAAVGTDLVKDPGCREDVDPRTAPQASHDGRTYYFCSESDRQRFVADPARYIQAAPAQPRPASGAGNVVITFRTVPSPPRGAAENEFEVTVKDRQGKPVDGADVSVVLFMPAMPAMKMPEMRNEVKLKAAGNGRYAGKGQVMMAGSWTVTVSVKQNGKEIGQQKGTIRAQ